MDKTDKNSAKDFCHPLGAVCTVQVQNHNSSLHIQVPAHMYIFARIYYNTNSNTCEGTKMCMLDDSLAIVYNALERHLHYHQLVSRFFLSINNCLGFHKFWNFASKVRLVKEQK